jgi:hypothetical protein
MFLMSALQNRIGLMLAGLFIVLGLGYNYYTPLWVPPDEERHLAYCEYIAQNKRLPHLDASEEGLHIAQALHPPLYYLIGSLFCSAEDELILQKVSINDGPGYTIIVPPANKDAPSYAREANSARRIRLISLLLGGLTVYLTFIIILNFLPGDTTVAAIGALLVATNPQFLHISASVSNESLSTALATLYLLILINYLKSPRSKFFYQTVSGIVLGCCLLTKISTILYVPVTAIALIWVNWGNWKNLIISFATIFLIAASVSFWWYLRNLIVYNDLIFTKALDVLQPWSMRQEPLSLHDAATLAKMTFISFWGYFGAQQIPITAIHLSFYGSLMVLGCAGLVKLIKKSKLSAFQIRALVLLFLSVCFGIAVYLQMNLRYPMAMGRYLFVIIAPIAMLTATGLRQLFPAPWRNYILIFIGFLLTAASLDVLFRVLRPAYAEMLLTTGVEQPLFCCPTPALNSNTTIGQTFVSPKNNLCAVRVMFSNEGQPPHGELRFTLQETGTHNKILCQIIVPTEKIEELNKYYFIFPPIPNSQDRRYRFFFDTQSMDRLSGVSLWYEEKNCYQDGTLLINGNPAKGALYFAAYHFTGKMPTTEWQGMQEKVINQGWYINIREMQHYGELSKDFRLKTTTHPKIFLLGKALKRRMNQSNKQE